MPGIARRIFGDDSHSSEPRIERDVAAALLRAIDNIGLRPSQASRRVGDYRLESLLGETDNHQDWFARHATLEGVQRRVRISTTKRALSAADRTLLFAAARRELAALEGIRHPAILGPRDFIESEQGPALVFDHDPRYERLDRFVTARPQLEPLPRLRLVRAVAEALHAAHKQRLQHRALSPQTVMVRADAESTADFDVLVFDWQIAARSLPGADTTSGGTLHAEVLSERSAQQLYMAPEALSAARSDAVRLDIFGLGALAYFVLTGVPPAADAAELLRKCEAGPGLTPAGLVNGLPPEVEELVQYATLPSAADRLLSVADFLAQRTADRDGHPPRLTSTRELAQRLAGDDEFARALELWAGAGADAHAAVRDLALSDAVPFLAVLTFSESGLRKRAVWEQVWNAQRREDAIDAAVQQELAGRDADAITAECKRRKAAQVGPIPVPPKYRREDFASPAYWPLRGALDVPRERFVLYPGQERSADPQAPLVLWAGHDHRERALALAVHITEVQQREETAAVRLPPALAGLDALLPWVAQWFPELDTNLGSTMADYLATLRDQMLATLGLSLDAVRRWAPPPPSSPRRRRG